MRRSTISFSVSVPVLSEKSHEICPSSSVSAVVRGIAARSARAGPSALCTHTKCCMRTSHMMRSA